MLHFRAWELGIKSLYYLRSKSVQRAGFAGELEDGRYWQARHSS
jgi:ribonucleoside-diphosphate reductase alpha chain